MLTWEITRWFEDVYYVCVYEHGVCVFSLTIFLVVE